MQGNDGDVKGEKDEELLIILSNAIVDPRAMMIHFANTSLADTAVMGPIGLYAAALCTFVDNLVFLESHSLDVGGSGITDGNCPRIRRHRLQVRSRSEQCEEGEDDPVGDAKNFAEIRVVEEEEDDEEGVDNQGPRHSSADVAANVSHQPNTETPETRKTLEK